MPTDAELLSELETLRKENQSLKAQKGAPRPIYFKVSEKGAISLYGLNRFPVTLYKEQWERVMDHVDALKEFIEVNASKIKVKEPQDLG